MGRPPCSDENGLKKGSWTHEEDDKLRMYIENHGHGSWRALPKNAGLNRCGKSCRLRWTNYLRPDIKRGKFSNEEEQTILHWHSILGNKWSSIASYLPGRTDNEIKNFWNTNLKKKLVRMGLDPITHTPRTHDHLCLVNLSQLITLIPYLTALDSIFCDAVLLPVRDNLEYSQQNQDQSLWLPQLCMGPQFQQGLPSSELAQTSHSNSLLSPLGHSITSSRDSQWGFLPTAPTSWPAPPVAIGTSTSPATTSSCQGSPCLLDDLEDSFLLEVQALLHENLS